MKHKRLVIHLKKCLLATLSFLLISSLVSGRRILNDGNLNSKQKEGINIRGHQHENTNNNFFKFHYNSTDNKISERSLESKSRRKNGRMRHRVKTFLCRLRRNEDICIRLGITPAPTISISPSSFPSPFASSFPSESKNPSKNPSVQPSTIPSTIPSLEHSALPTEYPSTIPTSEPSSYPSFYPSVIPTIQPSTTPSLMPITYQETCQFSTGVDVLECKDDLVSNYENESLRTIVEDQYICSENKEYRFGITSDQYLCLCDNRNNKKLWCVDADQCCRDGQDPHVVLEPNGNFVAYSERFLFSRFRTQTLWESDTQGASETNPVKIKLHNDGILRIEDLLDNNIVHWDLNYLLQDYDAKRDCI